MTVRCPHCGDIQPGQAAAHPCPQRLTPKGQPRWVNYKPHDQQETAE